MTVQDGIYRIGPESGRLLLRTGRTGMGSRAGHDLTIGALSWSGNVVVDTGEPARSSVAIEVDVASLHVVGGSGGVKSLTESDRADIERNIREKILNTARHPTITFRSTRVAGTPESFTVDGDLTIMDIARPVTATGHLDPDGRARGTATVTQSHWGIKPYSAFFGALKVADEVIVDIEVTLAS